MRLICSLLLIVCVFTVKSQIPASGNVLWLKADAAVFNDAGVTNAANGQSVQQWNDQSGNGNHVNQSTAANRPVFQTAQIGGQPALYFDGASGAKYLNNTVSNLVTAAGARTTFIVSKINAGSATGGTIFTFRRTTTINSLSLGVNGGVNYVYTDGVNGANNASAAYNIFDIAKRPFIATYSNASGGKIDFRFNTVSQSVSQTGTVGAETGTTGFTIGGREDFASWWQGLISEVIVYNRTLTPAELQQVESYLQIKYGITCSSQAVSKPGSGNAAFFPGTGSYGAYTPDSEDWNWGTGDFGIECWLNPGGTGQDNCIMTQSVGSASVAGTSSFFFSFNNTAANSMNLGLYTTTGTTWTNLISSPVNSLVAGVWQHVAVVRKAGVTNMYINGIQQTTTGSVAANIQNGSNPLELGMQNGTPLLGGSIDELRIYKGAAPDQTTIRDWMCKKTTASHPYFANMVANYNFDENTGTSYAADKINCHTMYLTGTAAFQTSAAAIGDMSANTYGGSAVTLTDVDNFTANNFTGVTGMQVYKVKEKPNSLAVAGFTEIKDSANYYGTFPIGTAPAYDAVYDYTTNGTLNGASYESNLIFVARNNNSVISWSKKNGVTNTSTNTIKASLTDRSEYLPATAAYPSRPGSGNAIRLNGSTQYVNIPDDNSLDFGNGNFTVQCWVKKNALTSGSNNVEIINKWTDGTATSEWWLGSSTGSDNIPSFYWQVGGTYSFVNAATSLALNKWNHISVTRVGPVISLYVNGILEGTGNIGTNSINNVTGRNLLMGARNAGTGNYSAIDIDEVQIFKGAGLSQTTIRDWMCKKLTASHPDYASLVSYYRFDEGSGTTLTDIKGSNDGALINTPSWVTSGAALGDVSAYDYSGNASTANVNFGITGADNLAATLNTGASAGIQVYGINERANTMNGVDSLPVNNRYGAVYVVNGNAGAAYNAVYSYGSNPGAAGYAADTLGLFKRSDNAASIWSMATSQSNNTVTKKITAAGQNTEYILGLKLPVPVPPSCAINFDGTAGAGVYVSNNAALNLTAAYTYEAWIKASTDISNYRAIINRDAYPNYAPGIFIGGSADANPGKIVVACNIGGVYKTFPGTSLVNDNQWHHVATTYDGANMKIYVDGILENTLAATGSLYGTTTPLGIGYNYSAANYPFIGKIDEVRIWNVARTAVQLSTSINNPLIGNETGLVAKYDFNNGSYNGNGQAIPNLCSNTGAVLNGLTTGTAGNPVFDCPNTTLPALNPPSCGIKFNGTSRVDVGNLGAMPDKGTIEFWMNEATFSNYQIMLSTIPLNSTSTDGIYFETYGTGELFVAFGGTGSVGGANSTFFSYGILTANRSYHVAVTWDITAGNYKGYLDGRLIFVQPLSFYPATLPRLTMGAGYNNGRYYNGTLDEVRYWNTERTQTEIVNNASSITGNETGLKAYYHFNENMLNGSGQTILNKATITGAALNGISANYVKFPCSLNPPTCGIKLSGAAGEGIQIPGNAAIDLTNAFTYQTWIKASTDISNYRCIFGKGAFATSAPSLMIASASSGSGGKLNGYYYIGSTLFSFVTPSTVNDNEWHHIAFTYDGAAVKVYIDGVLDFQQAATGVLTTNTGSLSIGYNFGTSNYPYVGSIDEFSVWNIARTQTDIQNSMNNPLTGNEAGLKAYYHFNDNNRSGQNRVVTNFCTITGSILNGSTYGTALIPVFECAPPPFTSPECNMQTNGTSDYVSVPNNAALGLSNFTVGAYVKTTDASGNYKNIVWKDVDGSNANYALYITNTNKAQFTFQRNPIAGIAPNATGTTTITDGNWHYLVGTYDGANLKIYVDGVLEATTVTSSVSMTGPGSLYLGTSAGSNKFTGSMDEISVWNRAITASEVTSLIGQTLAGTETGLVAYYNFNNNHTNGQAQTVTNLCSGTGAALNGTSTGAATTPIFTCSDILLTAPACAMIFNGNGDKAYVGGSGYNTAFAGITQNFTIEIKAKPLIQKGGSSGGQYDGVYSAQKFAIYPDQGGQLFGPGNAGSGISIGTNGVAVYEHSDNYIPARLVHNRTIDDWIHISIVYINGAPTLYENGAFVGSAGASGYIVHPSAIVSGYYGDYGGYVSEIRVWNRSLTGDEVRANVNANLTGAEANLAALYKFNNTGVDGSNKTINSFGSIGSIAANKLITSGSAKTPMFTCANNVYANYNLTGAGHMMSSGNYVGSQPNFTEMGNWGVMPAEGTISLWAYHVPTTYTVPVSGHNLFSTSNWNSDSVAWRGMRVVTTSTGGLDLVIGDDNSTGPGTSNLYNITATNIDLDWQHLAITWNKITNNITVYLDGIQKINVTNTKWPTTFSNVKIGTGYAVNSTNNFAGNIDELTYWNKQLTQTQVRDRMSTKIATTDALYGNLQHYYRFDDDDASGFIQDFKGTRHGMKYFGNNTYWSGTPLGDLSSYGFAGNSSTASVTCSSPSTDNMTATISNGNADGIIVFGNNDYANTLLFVTDTIGNNNRYGGVHIINGDANAAYTFVYDYTGNPYATGTIESNLKLFARSTSNLSTAWSQSTVSINTTTNKLTTTGGRVPASGISGGHYVLGKNNSVVPVKWISFTAWLNSNKQTSLVWKTGNETGVKNYEVEWSIDGRAWQKLFTVNYNVLAGGEYKGFHVKPLPGNNYYRIRQVDVDGQFSYSILQLVKLTDKFTISIYPNPAASVINIEGWNNIKKMALCDISGRKIVDWNTAQSTIPVSDLPAGIYILKVELTSGEHMEEKIMIAR